MARILLRCSGHLTCLRKCVCKDFHPATHPEFADPGSCYHNEHTNGEFIENYFVAYAKKENGIWVTIRE